MVRKTLNQRIAHLEMPARLKDLDISDEGYPVPWFVPYVDGLPEFRAMDGAKFKIAIRLHRCWMCGQAMGGLNTFAIGPMCMVNRTIGEPPSHIDCLCYAVQACPFLTQPKMRRNEKDKLQGHIAGEGIKRNPGVTALWTTFSFKPFRPSNGGTLFKLGDPVGLEFYTEGRRSTRAEIVASMESGLPILMEPARAEGRDAVAELCRLYAAATRLVPQDPPEDVHHRSEEDGEDKQHQGSV